MSLGGIPPFLGFLGKLVVLKALVASLNLVFVTGIIISALIIVYMYMSRVFFILRYSPNTKLITVRSRNIYQETFLPLKFVMINARCGELLASTGFSNTSKMNAFLKEMERKNAMLSQGKKCLLMILNFA